MRKWAEELMDVITVDADGGFHWFGRPVSEISLAEPSAAHKPLTEFLYDHFYCPGTAQPADCPDPVPAMVDRSLIDRCDTAFGGIRLRPHPVDRERVRWSEVIWRGTNGAAPVFEHPHGLNVSPGFRLYTLSDSTADPVGRTSRVYVNAWPGGFPLLLSTARRMWDALGLLTVKVAAPPVRPLRADACVLYLSSPVDAHPADALGELMDVMAPWLRGPVPAFTLRAGPGVALAESPPGAHESFGTSRCRLVAAAVIACWACDRSLERLPDFLASGFQAAGVDPERPYQSAGSRPLHRPGRTPRRRRPPMPAARLRDAGVELLHTVWTERIDADGEVFWLSADDRRARVADSSLYHGHAGLALAFARAAALGAEEMAEAASHAAAQALRSLDRLPMAGHHLGRPGALAALHLASTWLDDTTLTSRLRTEVHRFVEASSRRPQEGVWFDLLYGLAGTITALTALDRAYPQVGPLLESRLADLRGHLSRWAARGGGRPDLPPGLAHGIAGVVAAIAAATRRTGGPVVGEAVLRDLVGAEDGYFVAPSGNWRRQQYDVPVRHWPADRFFWCHGAPGILLSRLAMTAAAAPHGGLPVVSDVDGVRLALTRFPGAGHDWSLCHGAAGLAACARLASPQPHQAETTGPSTWDLLETAITQGRARPGWRPPIGLMNGRAGVALAALEMTDPQHAAPGLSLALGVEPIEAAARGGAPDRRRPVPAGWTPRRAGRLPPTGNG